MESYLNSQNTALSISQARPALVVNADARKDCFLSPRRRRVASARDPVVGTDLKQRTSSTNSVKPTNSTPQCSVSRPPAPAGEKSVEEQIVGEFATLTRLLLSFTGSEATPPSRRLRALAEGAPRMSLAQLYQEVAQRARTAESTACTLAEVLKKTQIQAARGSRSCSPDVMDFLRSERKDLRPENLALSFSPAREFVRPRRAPERPLSA